MGHWVSLVNHESCSLTDVSFKFTEPYERNWTVWAGVSTLTLVLLMLHHAARNMHIALGTHQTAEPTEDIEKASDRYQYEMYKYLGQADVDWWDKISSLLKALFLQGEPHAKGSRAVEWICLCRAMLLVEMLAPQTSQMDFPGPGLRATSPTEDSPTSEAAACWLAAGATVLRLMSCWQGLSAGRLDTKTS